MIGALVSIASGLLGEALAPTRCAACDVKVPPSSLFCVSCTVTVSPAGPQPDGQFAAFSYGGAVAVAIGRFKYESRFDLASRFARAMRSEVRASDFDVVVPVALHPSRIVERGFDQSALLAQGVAGALGIPCMLNAIRRTRATPRQAVLDRQARLTNVKGAFACHRPSRISGKRVLLVDDVRTTGATLEVCSRELCAAGAERVCTLVLASRDS